MSLWTDQVNNCQIHRLVKSVPLSGPNSVAPYFEWLEFNISYSCVLECVVQMTISTTLDLEQNEFESPGSTNGTFYVPSQSIARTQGLKQASLANIRPSKGLAVFKKRWIVLTDAGCWPVSIWIMCCWKWLLRSCWRSFWSRGGSCISR